MSALAPADAGTLVVAIDLGTSRSAYAYGTVGSEHHDIRMSTPDGNADGWDKDETAVLIEREDGAATEATSFGKAAIERYLDEENGKAVHPKWMLFRHFKMHLHKPGGYSSTFDPVAYAEDGQAMPLMHVFSAALKYFKVKILDRLNRSGFHVQVMDIKWMLTVPAIWLDFGKSFMQEAAFQAGLKSDRVDNVQVKLCLEPEAACLSVNATPESMRPWSPGDKIMVLDCGGGTVDITAHTLTQTQPLRLVELVAPCGGDWAAGKVDEGFKKFMESFLGAANWSKLKGTPRELTLMQRWEDQKIGYAKGAHLSLSLGDLADGLELEPKDLKLLKDVYNSSHPPEEHLGGMSRNLKIPPAVVEPWFSSQVSQIVAFVAELLLDKRLHGLKYIILVGGFSECSILRNAVRERFQDTSSINGLHVVEAPRPGLAIVKGAVLFASSEATFASRIARLTYGVRTTTKFKADKEEHKARRKQMEKINGKARIAVLSKHVTRGDDIPQGFRTRRSYSPISESHTGFALRLLTSRQKDVEYLRDTHVYTREVASIDIDLDMKKSFRDRGVDVEITFGGSEIEIAVFEKGTKNEIKSCSIDFKDEDDEGAVEAV